MHFFKVFLCVEAIYIVQDESVVKNITMNMTHLDRQNNASISTENPCLVNLFLA